MMLVKPLSTGSKFVVFDIIQKLQEEAVLS